MLVIGAADEQDAAAIVGDDAADADGVPGRLRVHDDPHTIMLRSILEFAVADAHVQHNVAASAKKPTSGRARREGQALPLDERRALMEAAAGLQGFRVHDLHHTAASVWLAARADPKVVQRVLGTPRHR